jgi:C_GCAxxG_C_C family probable redox protein
MNTNADNAVAMFDQGFNCAQAVLACCGQRFGLSREAACHVAQAFGGGMCFLDQTCGAVTGAVMVIGLKHGKTGADDGPKHEAQRLAQEFAKGFVARNGSIRCSQLLGYNLNKPEELGQARALGLFRTVCPKLVRDAAEIVDQLLENEGKVNQ